MLHVIVKTGGIPLTESSAMTDRIELENGFKKGIQSRNIREGTKIGGTVLQNAARLINLGKILIGDSQNRV